ncbi:MAG: carbonate dehydratase [Burkholderiaceae bacterium]|nr:MAG: carbonate dehydratase [Burkholderiaceae bacterium]
MPSSLQHLIANNRAWAAGMERERPGFFSALAQQQKPKYLWIGCSDSRVPANQIIGLDPGEVFVHRNVANVVLASDLNALSVIQFAVDVLKVEHILVVGHYGCGGVQAVLNEKRIGLADNWLMHVREVRLRNAARIAHMEKHAQLAALCELNVIEQCAHTAETTVVQDAWGRGQLLAIHGWCYGLHDGMVKDLGVTMTQAGTVQAVYHRALRRYPARPPKPGARHVPTAGQAPLE